jgi:hypothetical protein
MTQATATTTAVTTGNKVISSTSERAKAIIAKAAAKEQATAPLLTAKEVIDQVKTKPIIKPASKPTKAVAKPKEAKSPLFTCSEAIGIIMKKNPNGKAEQIINAADSLYIKKSGKSSNLFQMGKYYSFAVKFLKGYQSK